MKMMSELVWTHNGVRQSIDFADVNVAKSCYQSLQSIGVQSYLFIPSGIKDTYVRYEDDIVLSDEVFNKLAQKVNKMILVK